MQTRSKSEISNKKDFFTTIIAGVEDDLSQKGPISYKYALKSSMWCDAMKEELVVLHSQGTWTLVPLPSNKYLVGCKWVYKIKNNCRWYNF